MTDRLHPTPPPPADKAETTGGNYAQHIWASISFTVTLGIFCCILYPGAVFLIAQAIFPYQANGSLVKKDGTFAKDPGDAVGSALLAQGFSLPQYFHPRPSDAGNGYDPTSSGGSNLGPLSDKLINGATNPATTQPTTQPESLAFDGVRLRTLHYAMDNGITFKLYTSNQADGSHIAQVPLKQFLNADGTLNDVALVDAFPHPESDAPDKTPLVAGDFSEAIPGDAVTMSGSGLDPHISPANAQIQMARIAKARGITTDQVQQLINEHTDGPDLGFLGDQGVNVLMLNLALDAKYPMPTTQPSK
jgi:potassium-transporting ATPase KdpC subunit